SPLAFHRRFGHSRELIKAVGLEQIVIQTIFERARRHLFAAVAGQHDYPGPWPSLTHALENRQSVNPAQPIVRDHDIAAVAIEVLIKLKRTPGGQNLRARK